MRLIVCVHYNMCISCALVVNSVGSTDGCQKKPKLMTTRRKKLMHHTTVMDQLMAARSYMSAFDFHCNWPGFIGGGGGFTTTNGTLGLLLWNSCSGSADLVCLGSAGHVCTRFAESKCPGGGCSGSCGLIAAPMGVPTASTFCFLLAGNFSERPSGPSQLSFPLHDFLSSATSTEVVGP